MSRFSMDWSELSLQVMITFGHFLWQACVVGMLLAIVEQAFEMVSSRPRPLRSFETTPDVSRRSANFRYATACIAFFSLPICVVATFGWVHQSRGAIMLGIGDRMESPSSPMVSANEAIPTMANTDISVLPPPVTSTHAEVSATKRIESPTYVVEPQTSSVQRIEAFAPYLLFAYMVGVGFMLARFLLSIIGSSRLRRTIQPITDVKLLKTITEQCARLGLRRVPIVALCQRISVPVVVGIVKPMILLPPSLLCGLDPNQVAAILSHEMAHIRRYDLIVNLLQRVVEALLFFHPVTWWISRHVSIERENCCDDVAVACIGRLPYAGALLQMAELCIGNDRRRSAALATLSATGEKSTDLGYRIRRLIGAEETTRVGFTRRSFSIGLALVSLLTVSFVAWGQSQKSEDKKSEYGAAQMTQQAVIQALQNPEIELGNNPIAPIVLPNFPSKLRAIPQQDLVIDSVFNVLIDPPAELDIGERRNALRYLIFESPDRLTTLLINRLDTMQLLFPDTTGIAVPYDEIDALGQIGEAASDAIPVLTKFLNAEEPQVRGTAIEALIRVGPRSTEVMQSIATKFEDPHKVVRGLAVYQVGRYGKLANPLGPKFTELLNVDTNEVQFRAAAALITSDFNPDLGFKKLLESIQIGSIADRKLALSSLAMLGSRAESVLPELRRMIHDQNSELAKEVRETIRRIETNDRIFTHAEEAGKRSSDLKQIPITVGELAGEWSAQGNLVGLKCQLKSDPFDKGVRLLDVSVKVELKFDHSEEAISRYAQFHLSQDVDAERSGGRIVMAGRLANSQEGKEVNLVYHYRQEGVHGAQTRTVGKICRGNSGDLLLTLFPADSGIFDLEFDGLAPVEKLRLVKRDETPNSNDEQSTEEKLDSNKQSFKLIDGESGKPLQGLKCRAIVAKRNAPPRFQECTTDEHGVVEVVMAEGESAGIADSPSGWFSNGVGSVFVVQIPESEQQLQPNIEKRNEEPTVLKLWRGTEVDGRLLWPDKTAAAGVKLTAGVYISHQSWKEKLGMDLTWYSFDHGDWPNWSLTIVTDEDGKFRVTVPPKDARFWLRIGTTQLGFGPQLNFGENEAVTKRLAKCVPLEIQFGGNSRSSDLIVHDISDNDDMVLHAGDLQLVTGVIVRGRVVDAVGKGLSNVHLTSTGPHGPHSGRSATSGEDGKFEFPAMAAGNLTVHPDARLRDVTKALPEQVISRDVQAVFTDQSFTIPSVILPHEITVRAVPHTEVAFEWVDRRADKTQPIAYYGAFRVRGYMPDENGKPASYWTSETERIERNGKPWLTVKVPTQLLKPELMLVADSKVTASYSDSTGRTSGPGIVELGDITANTTRILFGDEPSEPVDSRKSLQRARNDHSSWIPARPSKVTISKRGSAKVLDDHSIRLEGDVQWQEASMQFKFDKPTIVQEIRLEILPVDSPTGPQFGRGGDELILFDVKPSIEDQTGKFTSLDFDRCTYLQNPSDETAINCIDYLSDTGWKVPKLAADTTSHELVLRFDKPIALRADQPLTLTVDSGGAKELAALNRIRFAFRQGE